MLRRENGTKNEHMEKNITNKEYTTPSSEIVELMSESNILIFSGGEASGDAGGESGWDE